MPSPTPEPLRLRVTYRVRLLPKRRHHRRLQQCLDTCRQIYNAAHEERLAAHQRFLRDEWIPAATRKASGLQKTERRNAAPTLYDQHKALTAIRADDPDIKAVGISLARGSLAMLDAAWKPVGSTGHRRQDAEAAPVQAAPPRPLAALPRPERRPDQQPPPRLQAARRHPVPLAPPAARRQPRRRPPPERRARRRLPRQPRRTLVRPPDVQRRHHAPAAPRPIRRHRPRPHRLRHRLRRPPPDGPAARTKRRQRAPCEAVDCLQTTGRAEPEPAPTSRHPRPPMPTPHASSHPEGARATADAGSVADRKPGQRYNPTHQKSSGRRHQAP